VDDNYIYLLSNFANGMNVYSKTGEYLGSFYVPYARNRGIQGTIIQERVFIKPKTDTYVFGFEGIEYYGKIKAEHE